MMASDTSASPIPRAKWLPLAVICVVVSAVLLFARLGHYDLWCDEADTTLFALGVLETGDMSAVLGRNVYALRDGCMLSDLKNRCTPPLPTYLTALFLGIFGADPLYARLPFALCGLAAVGFSIYWIRQDKVDLTTWGLLVLGLLGNISFFLYARQSRYYALATLATLVIVYLYLHWSGRRSTLLVMMFASIALLAAHYLTFFALYVTLAVDYLVWQRRRNPLGWRDWLLLLGPQAVVGIALVVVYNPLGHMGLMESTNRSWFADRLLLLGWNFRDLNVCEFGAGLVMLAAPLVYLWVSNPWLLRIPVAIVVYTVATTIASPQAVEQTTVADVRYLSPLIPACIFLAAISLRALTIRTRWLLAPLALVVFGSNLLNEPFSPQRWHSTPWLFAQELIAPRTTSVMAVNAWIREQVKPGATVCVIPNYQTYPLMYHNPQAIYGWQLSYPPAEQFRGLPEIQFAEQQPVDWIVVFGSSDSSIQHINRRFALHGIVYEKAAMLDVFWNDLTRPELFSHAFASLQGFNKLEEAVYIYRRHPLRQGTPPGTF